MNKLTACFWSILMLLLPTIILAQKNAVRFGKVTAADFENKEYSIDSSADAVYIVDIGNSQIVGNNKGFFSLEYKRYARVHILNQNGYDVSNVEIPLWTSNGGQAEEKLDKVKAVTYNLEGGKVVQTKLERGNIFTEKINKQVTVKKFTMPNVKAGSIIEFEYEVTSDFIENLQPWEFQGQHPRLWSEYNLSLPEFLDYVFLSQGYTNFDIKDRKDRVQQFNFSDAQSASATERASFNCQVTDYRWVMKDVKPLKPESYTSSIENYISKLEFQVAALKHPFTYRSLIDTWPNQTKKLLEDEDFGRSLDNANQYLADVVAPLITSGNDVQKAVRIYNYVRDNMTCTQHSGTYITQPLRQILKAKSGKANEINLLLVAMLRYAGIEADPVILSLKPYGFTHAVYPMMNRFNYVVVMVKIDGKQAFLDASRPTLGFGRLLPDCYNGHARVVNNEATQLNMSADNVAEKSITAVFITTDDKGNWIGNMNMTPGYYDSYNTRKELQTKGKDKFFADLKKDFGMDIEIENTQIDSIGRFEEPLSIKFDFKMNLDNEDLIYINPMFSEGWKENPFKSAERSYPVEMPYAMDETFIATIQIPEGYSVDELPKGMKLKFNEAGDGMFEYLIANSGNSISLRSRIRLARANFLPEEYEILRQFFGMIVAKQKEQIVLKKVK